MLESISFLIPAYNDNATIRAVVDEAKAVGRRVAKDVEIVVIDDASRTPINIRGVTLSSHETNQGYGRTIKELYYTGKNEWLFSIPGDYQIGAKELLKLIPHVKEADMILGWRVARHDPINRRIVSWVYNTLLRLFFGITIHDANSVRLMRRSVLRKIRLVSSSAFVDAELLLRARRAGFRVIEVPITHRARMDGSRGGGNKWRTIAATIVDMIRFLV